MRQIYGLAFGKLHKVLPMNGLRRNDFSLEYKCWYPYNYASAHALNAATFSRATIISSFKLPDVKLIFKRELR
jgi:hypothetical protein